MFSEVETTEDLKINLLARVIEKRAENDLNKEKLSGKRNINKTINYSQQKDWKNKLKLRHPSYHFLFIVSHLN